MPKRANSRWSLWHTALWRWVAGTTSTRQTAATSVHRRDRRTVCRSVPIAAVSKVTALWPTTDCDALLSRARARLVVRCDAVSMEKSGRHGDGQFCAAVFQVALGQLSFYGARGVVQNHAEAFKFFKGAPKAKLSMRTNGKDCEGTSCNACADGNRLHFFAVAISLHAVRAATKAVVLREPCNNVHIQMWRCSVVLLHCSAIHHSVPCFVTVA